MPEFDSKKPLGPVKIDRKVFKNIVLPDDADITAATRAFVEADVHVDPALTTYKVTEKEGVFARVSVGIKDGGGYYAMLKKVHGIWVVIVTGQDLPGKDTGLKYGLPSSWFSTEY